MKIALITGSHKGLGFEIARQLGQLPDFHVIVTSRQEAEGNAAAARLRSAGMAASARVLEVTSSTSRQALFAWIGEKFGRLDVLVNNAGVNPTGHPAEQSVLTAEPATLMRTFENNAVAALAVCQAAVPLMRVGPGRIVNVSTEMASLSQMASDYYPAAPSYRLSKVGLNAITVLLARELAGTGILVNAYSPGWMRTDMGGDQAPFSVEEGAATAVHLATLPAGGSQGGFFAELRKFGGPMRLDF